MMNLEKMRQRKRELCLTNQELSERSGIPLGTINKIFSGATKSPKYSTMLALETVLGMYFYRDKDGPYVSTARERAGNDETKGIYTIEDFEALSNQIGAELIDGHFYYMESPGTRHQEILGELYYQIKNYIRKIKGEHRVYMAPFPVRLERDDKTVVQPDLCIVRGTENLTPKGFKGPPEFIGEIVSEGTGKKDYILKLRKYWNAGVKEYWIIDPEKERIVTHVFLGEEMDMKIYGMRDKVPVAVCEGLEIHLENIEILQ